jgi:hypothetical protein
LKDNKKQKKGLKMDFHVIMPSKRNPTGLVSVTKCLQDTSMGVYPIKYTWVLDSDDETLNLLEGHSKQLKVNMDIQTPDKNLYARINKLADEEDAQLTAIINDDVHPLTQHWDYLAAMINSPVFAWKELNNPTSGNYTFLSMDWRHACGYCFCDKFPFWFADSWLGEVFMMSTDCILPIIDGLVLGGKRNPTRGLANLRFWFEYYQSTRPLRRKEAEKIKGEKISEVFDDVFEEWDKKCLQRCEEYGKYHAEKIPTTSERHAIALANAKNWMIENPKCPIEIQFSE